MYFEVDMHGYIEGYELWTCDGNLIWSVGFILECGTMIMDKL